MGVMEKINGHLLLLMAPSGSGKKMLLDGLGELADLLHFAKTFTSRARRHGTQENPHYVFLSRDKFEELITAGEFIEWAEFSGNLYGTSKYEVLESLQKSQVVFKEMELQGVKQVRELIPKEHLTIVYIDGGGWDELRRRILARAPISEEELALRRERYEIESKAKTEADVIIFNRNETELIGAHEEFREIVKKLIHTLNN